MSDRTDLADPFTDAPKGDRYVSVNGNKWMVSYFGRAYVRRDGETEWYGPSDKVYSTHDLASHGWVPVVRPKHAMNAALPQSHTTRT